MMFKRGDLVKLYNTGDWTRWNVGFFGSKKPSDFQEMEFSSKNGSEVGVFLGYIPDRSDRFRFSDRSIYEYMTILIRGQIAYGLTSSRWITVSEDKKD